MTVPQARVRSHKGSSVPTVDEMATLHLHCTDRRFSGAVWLLRLGPDGVQLVDSDGLQHAAFQHSEAERRFTFPSFWQSIKNLGVVTDRGDVVWFEPDQDNIADIRDYLESALAAKGPSAVRALSRKA